MQVWSLGSSMGVSHRQHPICAYHSVMVTLPVQRYNVYLVVGDAVHVATKFLPAHTLPKLYDGSRKGAYLNDRWLTLSSDCADVVSETGRQPHADPIKPASVATANQLEAAAVIQQHESNNSECGTPDRHLSIRLYRCGSRNFVAQHSHRWRSKSIKASTTEHYRPKPQTTHLFPTAMNDAVSRRQKASQ